MKSSHVVLFAALALSGCGQTETLTPPPPSQPPAPPAPVEIPAPPPARTLVGKPIMSTSVSNLVTDPDFQSLWTPLDETGYGLYEAFLEDGTAEVRFAPDTPRGPGAAILTVKPQGAATLTMMVNGGRGPLAAEVWIALRDGTKVDVSLASLMESSELPLKPVDEEAREIDGMRFVPYRRLVDRDYFGRLYLSATVRGTNGALFVGPEIVAKSAAKGQSTRSYAPARGPGRASEVARAFEALRNKLLAHHRAAPPGPEKLIPSAAW